MARNFFDILFGRKPKQPDFSDVRGSTTQSGAGGSGGSIRPDFRNVDSTGRSTEQPINQGGAGSTGMRSYTVVALSLIHISSPRDMRRSRMPSSA